MACVSIKRVEVSSYSGDRIYPGKKWLYRVEREVGDALPNQENIYITYAGSTIRNGIEFSGPTVVVIPANGMYVEFEVMIYATEKVYSGILNIAGTSSSSVSCGVANDTIITKEEYIDAGGNTGDVIIDEDGNISLPCCQYVPKEYIGWADGIGVPVLVSPLKRGV